MIKLHNAQAYQTPHNNIMFAMCEVNSIISHRDQVKTENMHIREFPSSYYNCSLEVELAQTHLAGPTLWSILTPDTACNTVDAFTYTVLHVVGNNTISTWLLHQYCVLENKATFCIREMEHMQRHVHRCSHARCMNNTSIV